MVFGSFDENNQILDRRPFGQGWITNFEFFPYHLISVENEDGSFSQDGYEESLIHNRVIFLVYPVNSVIMNLMHINYRKTGTTKFIASVHN